MSGSGEHGRVRALQEGKRRPGSIAEQSVDHRVNVLLGGGLARFQQIITGGPHVGKTVVESARLQGTQVVFDAASLNAAEEDHLLGLFAAGNMSLEWSGLQALAFPGSGFRAARPAAKTSGRRMNRLSPT